MKDLNTQYVKLSRKDYSLSSKITVVKEIESNCITQSDAIR